MDRRRRLVVVGVAMMALVVAGCSGGTEEASADVAPTAQVLAATEVPTPAPTATPIVIPTPAPIPTLIPEDEFVVMASNEIEEIKEVHIRFMTELFKRDEREPGAIERHLTLAEEIVVGEQLERLFELVTERSVRGEFVVSQGYESNVGAIDVVEGNRVRIFNCSRDTSSIFDAHGQPISEPDGTFMWRSTDLAKVTSGWAIANFIVDWDEPCDASAS